MTHELRATSIVPITHSIEHFQAVTCFTNLADESPEVPKLRNKSIKILNSTELIGNGCNYTMSLRSLQHRNRHFHLRNTRQRGARSLRSCASLIVGDRWQAIRNIRQLPTSFNKHSTARSTTGEQVNQMFTSFVSFWTLTTDLLMSKENGALRSLRVERLTSRPRLISITSLRYRRAEGSLQLCHKLKRLPMEKHGCVKRLQLVRTTVHAMTLVMNLMRTYHHCWR
ncbi:hypothetical protein K503DRAFT_715956 [Rhizopogon vinicolor AM-OR11-026]|uniref:Uncharacterized protein n=1 Tax=Rhizopogon vinicolor AM-OR11-026 TaxID=1314800 RepID=A0A1B7N4D7_9AGAM|nr:hypothetical protein K503DRAFT_715956 [Rhizopogon vinicolor AM-OR11-026]